VYVSSEGEKRKRKTTSQPLTKTGTAFAFTQTGSLDTATQQETTIS